MKRKSKRVFGLVSTLLTAICLSVLIGGFVTKAHAITFVDVWDANPNFTLDSSHRSYSYTHNILDNGYNPLTDTLTSANIALTFTDDDSDFSFLGFCLAQCERISISLDGSDSGIGEFEVNSGAASFNVLTKLADGTLNVVLNWQAGDIRFDSSTLTAQANRSESAAAPLAAQVPEPRSFILLGLGLLGMVWVMRRCQDGNAASA